MCIRDRLAKRPTQALAAIRKLLWEGWENDYERHLRQEVEVNQPLFDTRDHREARQAFVEKRKPSFTGR